MFGHYVVNLPLSSTDSFSSLEHLDAEDLGRKAQYSRLSIVHHFSAHMTAKFGESTALSEP